MFWLIGIPTIAVLLATLYYAMKDFGMDDSEPWLDVQVKTEWDEPRRIHGLTEVQRVKR